MNTDKLTTALGGLYGLDQLSRSVQAFTSDPSVENAIHVVAALAVCAWAYFTNKRITG